MKRDMDLIREILLTMEASPSSFAPQPFEVKGHTQEEIHYHAYLLDQAGLIKAANITVHNIESSEAIPISLTWAGHEFLDAARENTTWNEAKDAISKIGGATLQIWIAVLTAYITKKLGL